MRKPADLRKLSKGIPLEVSGANTHAHRWLSLQFLCRYKAVRMREVLQGHPRHRLLSQLEIDAEFDPTDKIIADSCPV